MNKNPIKKPSAAPTDRELEAALHDVLRKNGMLFPRTEEDLKVIEQHVDSCVGPQPDLERFKALLADHIAGNDKVVPFRPEEPDTEIIEDFARAARNGGEIPPAIIEKMAANRKRAEAQFAAEKQQREERR